MVDHDKLIKRINELVESDPMLEESLEVLDIKYKLFMMDR